MTASTTFGYHAGEDRVWISCTAWPQRIWITRRMARGIVQLVATALEKAPPGAPDADSRPPAERAAADHDASLNRVQPGEPARALQMGREASDAPELASAVLCTQVDLRDDGVQAVLAFHTSAGQRQLLLSRVGLHRWLRGLHIVLGTTDWADWAPLPDWLTRSYLPPALGALLVVPPATGDGGDAPAPPPGA